MKPVHGQYTDTRRRGPKDQFIPAIYGDIVVWEDERNGNYDIYGYNLSTKEEFQITTDPNRQFIPAIYGDIVVWEDWRNGYCDIYAYDISAIFLTKLSSLFSPLCIILIIMTIIIVVVLVLKKVKWKMFSTETFRESDTRMERIREEKEKLQKKFENGLISEKEYNILIGEIDRKITKLKNKKIK